MVTLKIIYVNFIPREYIIAALPITVQNILLNQHKSTLESRVLKPTTKLNTKSKLRPFGHKDESNEFFSFSDIM